LKEKDAWHDCIRAAAAEKILDQRSFHLDIQFIVLNGLQYRLDVTDQTGLAESNIR